MYPTPQGDRLDLSTALEEARVVLVEVYRYLRPRCGSATLAEDLTSDVVMAAVDRLASGEIERLTVAYAVGIARHKLVDHWRSAERDRRRLRLLEGRAVEFSHDVVFEPDRSAEALSLISDVHRAALTLRYVDDLRVPEVAAYLGRSVASTETLLMRAKRSFRAAYEQTEHDDDRP